jgi:hypothetical protein
MNKFYLTKYQKLQKQHLVMISLHFIELHDEYDLHIEKTEKHWENSENMAITFAYFENPLENIKREKILFIPKIKGTIIFT